MKAAIAAALTSLMILLFLGSWRSTVIIAPVDPAGDPRGGRGAGGVRADAERDDAGRAGASRVGILVDDATVTIENINWHLEQGKGVTEAILDGAAQIVTPAFVSLLCICIVFVPMFFLPGVAGFLFVPMALSVVFAMIASFVLSRTAGADHGDVPAQAAPAGQRGRASRPAPLNRVTRWSASSAGSKNGSNACAATISACSTRALGARKPFLLGFLAIVLLSFALMPLLGSNFFPQRRFRPDRDARPRARRRTDRGDRR